MSTGIIQRLLVFGRAHCPYTENFIRGLVGLGIPFMYRGLQDNEESDKYWQKLKKLQIYPDNWEFLFPTVILLVKTRDGKYERYEWGTTESAVILKILADHIHDWHISLPSDAALQTTHTREYVMAHLNEVLSKCWIFAPSQEAFL